MSGVQRPRFPARVAIVTLAFAIAASAIPAVASAQATFSSSQGEAVTYAGDVAAIINENCVVCHREGGVAPMPLTTYEEVQARARLIRTRVADRQMPPWHIDPNIGIQEFKADRSLT